MSTAKQQIENVRCNATQTQIAEKLNSYGAENGKTHHSPGDFHARKLIINKLLSMKAKQMNERMARVIAIMAAAADADADVAHAAAALRCCEQFSALCIKCNLNY